MNCREYQHQITLLLYEELPEAERSGLEAHLHECEGCKSTYEEERSLHMTLSEDPSGWEVPADLLVQARRSLADELDRVEKKRPWWRVPTFSVVFTPMRMLESAALVAMGLALGVYVSSQEPITPTASNTASETQQVSSVIPRNSTFSNLRIVNTDPSTGQVELAGEVVQPMRLQGNLGDDMVRRLLFMALRDTTNAGARLQAAEVLAREPKNAAVKEALIHALIYDENPGVRQKAIEGLTPFAAEEDVRSAFLQALASDSDAGIRVEAINALSKTQGSRDDAFARTIQEITKEESNPYVRMRALQFVGSGQ
jgi:hypothetical protein